ncbi:unnamed protein product [Parascedosporium putredinis]|uniref:Dolichyl-diphosphooligosaccharide--protein glycosyltransferase subunit 4 n=1 Tax=Parascedosporium putredinis TaxID=1442378 RepID=A0A9P1GYX8_9PEZI|nr:unnamed protein product [Parascedosporium putredinis]CAI7990557.1 unnamed protein product [Parascedosporium putredinis]
MDAPRRLTGSIDVTPQHNRLLTESRATMISDGDLYTLAIALGCVSAVLIVVYHFIEVNAGAISRYEQELAQEASKPPKAAR